MTYKYLRILFALTAAVIFFDISGVCASATVFNPNFSIESESALMINLDKDMTVYEKNPTKKMYPASLTKIMTAIVVLDNVDDIENTWFEAPLAVYDDLYMTGALTVGYNKGEIIRVKDLLYSMVIYSACESAGILAYNVGNESIPNFVDMMNDKAKEIGCTGTHFVNPHGLHDKNQYTNACDLALITRYALDNYPLFKEIACTWEYELGETRGVNTHSDGWMTIRHTNKMMNPSSEFYYEGVSGIKTGTTDESGRNLISLGSRDGNNYLLITLGAKVYDENGYNSYGNFEDHVKLYDWAFEKLSYQQIIPFGKEVTELTVKMGKNRDFVRLVTSESSLMLWSSDIDPDKLKATFRTDEFTSPDGTITAPVVKGQKLGTYTLSLNGEDICTVDLVAQEDVELSITEYNKAKIKDFFHSMWFKGALIAAGVLFAGYIAAALGLGRGRSKKRKMKKVRRNRRF